MDKKRRLPVLQNTSAASSSTDDGPPPSRMQWVGLGVVASFAAWLPFAYAAEALLAAVVRRTVGEFNSQEELATLTVTLAEPTRRALFILMVGARLVPLALGVFAGAAISGRWGSGWRPNDGALVGAIVVALAMGLTWFSFGVSLASVSVFAFAIPLAWLGGREGARRRGPSP